MNDDFKWNFTVTYQLPKGYLDELQRVYQSLLDVDQVEEQVDQMTEFPDAMAVIERVK